MCKKLFYLVSLILVLSVTGKTSADLVVHWRLDEGSVLLLMTAPAMVMMVNSLAIHSG